MPGTWVLRPYGLKPPGSGAVGLWRRPVPLDVGEAVQRRAVGHGFGGGQGVVVVQGGREEQLGALFELGEGDLEEAELVEVEDFELVEVLGERERLGLQRP